MRFSTLFEPSPPVRSAPAREQALAPAQVAPAPPVQPPPDDLDQRVRETGEWQLEDW